MLRPGQRTRGVMTWIDEAGRTLTSQTSSTRATAARFHNVDAIGARRSLEQRLGLAITRVGFGERLWFAIDGKRAARVALAPGGERFEAA